MPDPCPPLGSTSASARVGVPTETLPPLVTKPLEVGTAIVSPSVSSPMVNTPAICAAAMLLVSFAESVATWAPPRLLMPMNPAAALPQPWLAAPPASTGVGLAARLPGVAGGMSYWVRIEGLLLNRSRLWLPAVSFPYRPKVRVFRLLAAICLIALDMSKSPGTVPPEHMVPFPLPTDLSDLEVIGLPRASTPGWLFQLRPVPMPPVHLTVMVSEPWPQESHAESTSLIFSVELAILKLDASALVSTE